MRRGTRGNAGITAAKRKKCVHCSELMPAALQQCPFCRTFQWKGATDQLHLVGTDGTILLCDIKKQKGGKRPRLQTGEWDECFGTDPIGIADDGVYLVGGAPGAGKSTLSLQVSEVIAEKTGRETFYIGAEESGDQIDDRAERLALMARDDSDKAPKIRVCPLVGNEVQDVASLLDQYKPSAVIFDSISEDEDIDGAVTIAKNLKTFAVKYKAPVFLIGHINKKNDIAGLMRLQHAVDALITLFQIEVSDEEKALYEEAVGYEIKDEIRELTTVKNRYGRAGVVKQFAMTLHGLKHIPEVDLSELDDEDDDE